MCNPYWPSSSKEILLHAEDDYGISSIVYIPEDDSEEITISFIDSEGLVFKHDVEGSFTIYKNGMYPFRGIDIGGNEIEIIYEELKLDTVSPNLLIDIS